MSRFKRHISSLMLGRPNIRESTEGVSNTIPSSHSTTAISSDPKMKTKSILKQTSTNHLHGTNPTHSRFDSVSGDHKATVQPEQQANPAAQSTSRRDGARTWRRRLDNEVLADLRYACYALDALIQTGQPAAPATINAAVEAAASKGGQRRRMDPKSASNHSIPAQQPPPTTAAHRSRAVSNPGVPVPVDLPPVPSTTRSNIPPSGVRLLSSAFSQAEERRASASEEKNMAVELPAHETQMKPPPLTLGRQALRIVPSEEEESRENGSPTSAKTLPNYPPGNTRDQQIRRIASSGEGIIGNSSRITKKQSKHVPHDESHSHHHGELTDESYSTPRSVSDRAASTARTSLPTTPSGRSAVNGGNSPAKKAPQLSALETTFSPTSPPPIVPNRHSRRPSSKIIIPPSKDFNAHIVAKPVEEPVVAPAPTKSTLRSISSQFFRLRSRKSHKNLTSTEPLPNPPPTSDGSHPYTWKAAISGLRSKTSRMSLRDFTADANSTSSTNPRGSNDADLPPMPPLENLAKYNGQIAVDKVGVRTQAEPDVLPLRPTTAHGPPTGSISFSGGPSIVDAPRSSTSHNQPAEKSFRPLSTIKNNLRKSRSSIFLRNGNHPTLTHEPLKAHAEESEQLHSGQQGDATSTMASSNPSKLRKMLSALQFPTVNRQQISDLSQNENGIKHDDGLAQNSETSAAPAPVVGY